MIFTAEMMLVPALLYTYLLLPFRAVKPVHVSKNTAVDNLIKRSDPLLDHIVDSERSLEVHNDVIE